jgi:hypothetical protein
MSCSLDHAHAVALLARTRCQTPAHAVPSRRRTVRAAPRRSLVRCQKTLPARAAAPPLTVVPHRRRTRTPSKPRRSRRAKPSPSRAQNCSPSSIKPRLKTTSKYLFSKSCFEFIVNYCCNDAIWRFTCMILGMRCIRVAKIEPRDNTLNIRMIL